MTAAQKQESGNADLQIGIMRRHLFRHAAERMTDSCRSRQSCRKADRSLPGKSSENNPLG
jgi:hypothetical protein